MRRRDLIKYLSVAPLAGGVIGNGFPFQTAMASPPAKRDLFKELGVRTFINATATLTYMTGSLMHDYVLDAINDSSQEFCLLDELQDKVGERIAVMVHSEAATVTSGCYSAMVLGLTGVLTGMDQKKVEQIPFLQGTGMKSEVIVQKSHNVGYVHALTLTGVSIVPVETREEAENAINEKTAMMWFLNYNGPLGKIQHQEWVEIAKKHKIPSMIDIAADVPPVENLWKYNDMGFDMVCVSGGKAIRGPQSAGILMGRKDIVAAARLSAPPRGNNIGRGMKVNKEEILGMYVALEKYINRDHDKEWKMWEDKISLINDAVKNINGVTTEINVPPVANHTPNLVISWDSNKVKILPKDLQEYLRKGDPSIEVGGGENNSIRIAVFLLKRGQEKIVARRVKEELSKAAV